MDPSPSRERRPLDTTSSVALAAIACQFPDQFLPVTHSLCGPRVIPGMRSVGLGPTSRLSLYWLFARVAMAPTCLAATINGGQNLVDSSPGPILGRLGSKSNLRR